MTPDTPSPALRRSRRWVVRAVMALATLLAVAAIFSVWADRQVLDADNWADTSSELLENPAIRTQIATVVVDGIYASGDVTAELAAALPPRLDPLAGPAANALRGFAEDRTAELLGRPRIQAGWERVNRVAAQQFIDVVEGNSGALTTSGDDVVLDLRVLAGDVAARLGGSGTLVAKIPPGAGRLTIMRSGQAGTLQSGVAAVQGLSAILPALAVALFALAVFLSPGRRRRTLMLSGGCLILAGAIVLVGRTLASGYVVDALATTAAVVPAAEAAWSIGTDMLRDIAQAMIVAGIPVVVAGWLAGPARAAVALRRAAAPWLRTRPHLAYGVLAAALLLVIAWEPIPATRSVLGVLLMAGLSVAGLEVLRRQTAREFPDATQDDVREGLRAGFSRIAGQARPGERAAPPEPVPEPEPVSVTPARRFTRIDELERLAALHDSGALSDDEFADEKRHLAGVG
jgi:hypothetical protein